MIIETGERTDRQTGRQTDTLIIIFRTSNGGKVLRRVHTWKVEFWRVELNSV